MMRSLAVAAITASTALGARLITGPADKIIEGEYIVKLSSVSLIIVSEAIFDYILI